MKMQIGGEWTEAAGGAWVQVTNPATGERIDHVPAGDRRDVDAAVTAAESAFPGWERRSYGERGMVLGRCARLLRERIPALAPVLTREQGKPLAEATGELMGLAHVLEHYHSIAGSVSGEYRNLRLYGSAMVTHTPLGVVGAIIPWNMPALLMGWKVGPALVAGNTMVLKPATSTPLTTLALAGLFEEAGLPPGVLNVVTGSGHAAGEPLVLHPTVKKVSFTGQVETGRRIAELAARDFTRTTLELGGCDPMIVCDDADIGTAVAGAVRGRFFNCGQVCTAVKRLYVFESIAEHFETQLAARVAGLRVGNGMDHGVDMGPLNNAEQHRAITALVDGVQERGEGTVVVGGAVLEGEEFARGNFYAPTLVTEVAAESPLLREEVFGPVLPVVRVENLDDAIAQANASRYGLGASIWTHDIRRITTACEQLQAGIVWVNQHLRIPPEVPFGGTKESGIGRENGYGSIDDYSNIKSILIAPGKAR
ncbi:MAG TPA: aldehyde dehydrogenase [Methanoculleus sp.]|nr:aldehyde dehydrogenase [Methanoculleus sp.]